MRIKSRVLWQNSKRLEKFAHSFHGYPTVVFNHNSNIRHRNIKLIKNCDSVKSTFLFENRVASGKRYTAIDYKPHLEYLYMIKSKGLVIVVSWGWLTVK